MTTTELDDAIDAVAAATGLAVDRIQIRYDRRDDDPEGGPPVPWSIEVDLPPAHKRGVRRSVQGYGTTLAEATTEAISAVERHR